MYHLDNESLRNNPWITIVGAGGTGGFVAEGICRLFQGRDASIVLVDHDRVEPHNLLRQNFYENDVGKFKSQVLAERLSAAFGRDGWVLHLSVRGVQSRSTPPPVPGNFLIRRGPADRLHGQRGGSRGYGQGAARQQVCLA